MSDMFYLIIASNIACVIIGWFAARYVDDRWNFIRGEIHRHELHRTWSDAYDAGWNAASSDTENVKISYHKIFLSDR